MTRSRDTANIVDLANAKGDIYTATAADTPAALSVGSDGSTLVADSAATTGLRWTTPVASLANPVINGGFDIWQRGTSIAGAADTANYTADRWVGYRAGSTFSRQTATDSTNLPNIQYCARVQRNSGTSGTSSIILSQSYETVNSIPFAGKAVTISFYARKGADYSGGALTLGLYSGTGTDQRSLAGYTGSVQVAGVSATLTTTWQRFVGTGTVPTTCNELASDFSWTPSGTAGANDYVEITGVQIDVGTYTTTTAPTFRRSGNTLAGELAACQRYYYRVNSGSGGAAMATGAARSTTVIYAFVPLPVTMRVAPTSMDLANITAEDYSGTQYNTGTFTLESGAQTQNMAWVRYTHGSAALTQYRPAVYTVTSNYSSAYIGFSAEL